MPTPEETQQMPSMVQGAGLVVHTGAEAHVDIGEQHSYFHRTVPDYQHQRHYHLPCRIPTFTGRIGQLMKLELSLTQYAGSIIGEAKEFREHQVSGLGGVGKTSLALEYAHRMLHVRRYDYAIWLNANNANQLMLEMMDLALTFKLGADIKHLKEKYFTNQNIIKAVYKYLYTQADYSKVLIIFDNVDQLAVLRGQMMQPQDETVVSLSAGASAHVEMDDDDDDDKSSTSHASPTIVEQQERQIVEALNFMPEQIDCAQTDKTLHWLITTRDQSEQQLYPDRHLALHGFSPQEAIQYIQSRLGSETPVDQCHRLAHTLHYFPLALAQAVASIEQMQESSIAEYLELYTNTKEAQKEFLTTKLPYPDPYKEAVYTTWRISYEKLSKAAQQMIRMLCYLDAINIPFLLVEKLGEITSKLDSLQVRGVIDLLVKSSLIQKDQQIKELMVTFKIHRMLREVICMETISEQGEVEVARFLLSIVMSIDVVYPWDKRTARDIAFVKIIAPHCENILTSIESTSRWIFLACLVSFRLRLLLILGDVYGEKGELRKKIEVLMKAVAMKQAIYGKDNHEVAHTLVNLAQAYGELGKPFVRRELLKKALIIGERHYGRDHHKLAITLTNLGSVNLRLGKIDEGRVLLERSLAIKEKHHGLEHPEVAITLINLANAYGFLGDYKKQSSLLNRAFLIQKNHYGERHYLVARTMSNLANSYGEVGDYIKKKELLESAFPILVQHYGEKYYEIAIHLRNLANTYGALGDVRRQNIILKKAVSLQEEHYGRKNYEVAITLVNLAISYGDLGDHQRKKLILEEVLEIQVAHYGETHYEVACTLTNLANAIIAMNGDLDYSELILKKALLVKEEHYGKDHDMVLHTLTSMSVLYLAMGKMKLRKNVLARILSINKNKYGEDHYQTARTLVDFAMSHTDTTDLELMKEMLEKASLILEQHYGSEHFIVAKAQENLAIVMGTMGKFQEKKEILERVLIVLRSHCGENHHETAKALYNLGETYVSIQEKVEGLQRIRGAYETLINTVEFGRDHPLVVRIRRRISELEES